MSDRIPFHIQEEIMKRLPPKSLVQFRCVSKPWKSLIDSPEFMVDHSRHTHPHHLLVSYDNPIVDDDYVCFSQSYIDNDTFPQQCSVPTLPLSIKQLDFPLVIGGSQGLLCLYGSHPNPTTHKAVIVNPAIRKSIVVLMPYFGACPIRGDPVKPPVGFGVCPVTNDPKIVAITELSEFMVYTLSSGEWRSLPTNLPNTRTQGSPVVTNRFIYWEVQLEDVKMIRSFDLTNESFEMIHLPDSLARLHSCSVQICKLRESLALLQSGDDYISSIVWLMGDGAQKSFTKLFTITAPHESIVGFRKNGVPIMTVTDDDDDYVTKLAVYEPNSEHNGVLDSRNIPYHFSVHSYMETQLLHGRSGCTSY